MDLQSTARTALVTGGPDVQGVRLDSCKN